MPHFSMTNSLPKFLFLFIFIISTSFPLNTMAGGIAGQSEPAPSETQSNADIYQGLANLIEDPDSRDKLVKELKALSNNPDKSAEEKSTAEKAESSDKTNDNSFAAAIAEQDLTRSGQRRAYTYISIGVLLVTIIALCYPSNVQDV